MSFRHPYWGLVIKTCLYFMTGIKCIKNWRNVVTHRQSFVTSAFVHSTLYLYMTDPKTNMSAKCTYISLCDLHNVITHLRLMDSHRKRSNWPYIGLWKQYILLHNANLMQCIKLTWQLCVIWQCVKHATNEYLLEYHI